MVEADNLGPSFLMLRYISNETTKTITRVIVPRITFFISGIGGPKNETVACVATNTNVEEIRRISLFFMFL